MNQVRFVNFMYRADRKVFPAARDVLLSFHGTSAGFDLHPHLVVLLLADDALLQQRIVVIRKPELFQDALLFLFAHGMLPLSIFLSMK